MPFKKADPSEMLYARKVRIAADDETLGHFDGQSKICNWLWNRLKQEVEADFHLLSHGYYYGAMNEDLERQILSGIYSEQGLRNRVPELKERFPFLRLVHSSPLKNIALRMAKAIDKHRKAKATGQDCAWISFKAWRQEWMSIEYEERGKGWKVTGKTLKLSFGAKDGKHLHKTVRLINPTTGLSKAKGCRIIREGRDRYFAVFTFSAQKPRIKELKASVPLRRVYLDPNQKNFAYGLDASGKGFEIANPKQRIENERLTDLLKGKRDKAVKKSLWVDTVHEDGSISTHARPSRQWFKRNAVLERHEQKVREQTKHYHYALANHLCATYDDIGIGNYVPDNTDHGKGRKYNRALRNRTTHGEFKKVLLWVATKSGKSARVFDESGTTRTCHVCDYVVEGGIHPKIREWDCPVCKTHHLRDENSCQNGLLKMATLEVGSLEMPCSGPVLVSERCDWHFHPQGWREIPQGSASVNQKRPPEYRRNRRRKLHRQGGAPVSKSAQNAGRYAQSIAGAHDCAG